jgi:hypothetical protein
MDGNESGAGQGEIHTVDANGNRTVWQGDVVTNRDWDEWRARRPANAVSASSPLAKATAPLVETGFRGERVALDQLEDDPSRFVGQQVSVDGEVDEVLGPRLFTIDEPDWGDIEGELIVFLPGRLVAAVQDGDRITVSGTVRRFVRAEIEREWGWLGTDPEIEVSLSRKPVIVADRIVGGDNNRVMVIEVMPKGDQPVGTSGGSGADATAPKDGAAIEDIRRIASAGDALVGHRVALAGARVVATRDRGLVIASGDDKVFVLHEGKEARQPTGGQTVAIEGVVLDMPDDMTERLEADGLNDEVYVYATSVR